MKLCDDDHDQIAYEGHFCPICQLLTQKDNLIDSLMDQAIAKAELITELKNELNEAHNTIADLERRLPQEQE